MDIKDNTKKELTDQPQTSEVTSAEAFKAKTNKQLNEENPARQKRRQATEDELNNPLHGVKLPEILERLVKYYGWTYLADRTNIRCFKFSPTMKSSLGFLRKMKWARVFIEDIYLDMLEDLERIERQKQDGM